MPFNNGACRTGSNSTTKDAIFQRTKKNTFCIVWVFTFLPGSTRGRFRFYPQSPLNYKYSSSRGHTYRPVLGLTFIAHIFMVQYSHCSSTSVKCWILATLALALLATGTPKPDSRKKRLVNYRHQLMTPAEIRTPAQPLVSDGRSYR